MWQKKCGSRATPCSSSTAQESFLMRCCRGPDAPRPEKRKQRKLQTLVWTAPKQTTTSHLPSCGGKDRIWLWLKSRTLSERSFPERNVLRSRRENFGEMKKRRRDDQPNSPGISDKLLCARDKFLRLLRVPNVFPTRDILCVCIVKKHF